MADKFQLKALITGVDKLSPVLAGVRGKLAGFRKSLQKSGLTDFSFGGLALAAPLLQATRSAIGFESAMADVRKVVDFPTPEAFKRMSDDIVKMSMGMPMAADGIAAIVAAGGQAGIAREELKDFAADAVRMGIAFDQTAEQSGDMMAKWRTAFRMTQPEVVALADKINFLSNNTAASAQQISQIVTRIGPLGEVAGLASGEIAAMGAALAGIGVQEEIAATGMKNFMLTLTSGKSATATQAKVFKALRMDAAQVAADMQKDARGTMLKVLTAISKVDKTKQAGVLSQLFGRESIGAIAPLLTNLENLRKNFALVADATQYAGSMQKEYEARCATTENALTTLKNQFNAVGVAIGSAVLPAIVSATTALAPYLGALYDFLSANPAVIKGLLGAAAGLVSLKAGAVAVGVAIKALTMLGSLTPVGLAIRGIALAVGAVIANWKELTELWGKAKDMLARVFNWGPKNAEAPVTEKTISQQPLQIGNGARANVDVNVNFTNAPAGMRVAPAKSDKGAQVSTAVGYRSLAFEGGD